MAKPASPPRRKPRFRERNAAIQSVPAPAIAREAPPPPQRTPPPRRARETPRSAPRITVEKALYAALVLTAFGLRIWDVGSRAMHGDESVHAWFAWNLYNGSGYQYDPVYHGPLQFPVTAFFFFLFGVSNTSGRLMAVLFGTALVALPFFFRREMGRAAALLSSAFLAVSPAFVYDSRLERDDIFTSFFAITLAIAIFGYVRTRRSGYVYLAAASIALSLAAMENTYITLFVFGSFLVIVFISQYPARRGVGDRLHDFWQRTGPAEHPEGWMVSGFAVLLLLAFALTVATGLYLPVPLVLAVGLIALVHRQSFLAARGEEGPRFLDALGSISRQTWINAVTILVAILFLFFSTFGTNMHGIWDASQPFFNSGNACPGNNFPLNPCRKDIIGGLFYWLSQHKVARGGQPWFYYSLLDGLYEQIAVVFGVAGILWFMRRPTIFTSFLTYWAIVSFMIYSWAGEKFPWLMIHALTPFLLLGAMFVVDLVRRGGLARYLVLGVLALLGILEIHSMYEVNYVYGADPVEMMVYVQSSPDTPRVAQNIQTISNKVTNGNALHVTIDTEETWPFAWYLRGMPDVAYPGYPQILQKPYSTNPVILVDKAHQAALYPQLKGKYTGHEYRLRWWFPEDYKTLTWDSFARDAINPGYWSVIAQWLIERRPFGPKGAVWFYYYVKKGYVSPF